MKKILFFLCVALPYTVSSQSLKPDEKNVLTSVKVVNAAQKPYINASVVFTGIKSKKKQVVLTDNAGKTSLLLPKGDRYAIQFLNLTEVIDYDTIVIDNEPGAYTLKVDLSYQPGEKYTLSNIEFDVNKATLRPSSHVTLNDLAEALQRNATIRIELGGHTDSDGDAKKNQNLSQQRAASVKAFLVNKGISESRIEAVGYGDSDPIAANDSAINKQKNRRTELRILVK